MQIELELPRQQQKNLVDYEDEDDGAEVQVQKKVKTA